MILNGDAYLKGYVPGSFPKFSGQCQFFEVAGLSIPRLLHDVTAPQRIWWGFLIVLVPDEFLNRYGFK
jgi:hypothetical protein